MTYKQFKKIFDNFINKNVELISVYESTCDESIEDFIDYIFQVISTTSEKYSSSDISNILKQSLNECIDKKCSLVDSLDKFLLNPSVNLSELSTTEKYFREVNDIYVKNDNNYDIEYCPENREKLLEMNLKTVISVAKRYIGLGLPLEDLIQAGNEGLCQAYKKYKPERAKLKEIALEAIDKLPEKISCGELYDCLSEYIKYGKVKDKFLQTFTNDQEYDKEFVQKWVKKNIKNAKFNSVATMWIRAYIINSINDESRIVRKPKTEIYKDAIENGSYAKETTIDIDAPVSDDGNSTVGDILNLDEEKYSDIEVQEAYDIYKRNLKLLLTGVKSRDRGIFLKKFGIGLPREITPKEIAEQEGLSIARVSQIFQIVEAQIQKNVIKYNIDIDELFDAAKKL